jgi:hypothetical protein
MSIPTQIDIAQFDMLIDRFAVEIGSHTWRQRCENNVKACQRNPLLAEYLNEEFAIPHALALCASAKTQYGSLAPIAGDGHWMYPAMGFVSQALFMIGQATSPTLRRSLTGRVADAIADNDSMRALLLELGTATHFARRGQRIVWPELEGVGTFDLLLPDLGKLGLEFECKSISADKGRRITREEAINFYGYLYERLLQHSAEIAGHRAIRITIPVRLPTSDIELRALASAVLADILGDVGTVRPGYEMLIRNIPGEDICWQGEPIAPNLTRQRIADFTGTSNRESAIIGTPGKGVILLAIQSAKSDHLLKSIHDVLADAAKRQLTKTRPGILVAGLAGVDSEALIRVAGQDNASGQPNTLLARAAERFLDAPHRAHVVGLSFKGRSALNPGPGYVDSGGAAYHFSNAGSIFWEDAFRGLFRPSPT